MKLILLSVCILSWFTVSYSQAKPTSEADYKGTFQYAVSEANDAFPFVFTVTIEEFENGRLMLTETMVDERQSAGVERITTTLVRDGKTSVSYKISTGFGSVYCSKDGVSWEGPQKYECSGPSRMYGRREIEKSEYSVEEKTIDGQAVKLYREYLIYATGKSSGQKEFKETIATINSEGFFISVENTEGSVDPRAVKLIRKQTWDFKTKIRPIVAPK